MCVIRDNNVFCLSTNLLTLYQSATYENLEDKKSDKL